MSLRALMTVLVGLLVLVALAFAANVLRQSSVALGSATLLAERNRIADSCLQAVKYFAFERGRSNVILHDPEPISRENRRFIDEHRAAADIHISEVLINLPDSLVSKADAVKTARDAVMALRPALERDFALHPDQRDAALPIEWMEAANTFVASLERLLIDISNLTSQVDAGFNSLSDLRIRALQFRNVVGQESTVFAGAAANQLAVGMAVLGTAQQLRGRSMQLWQQIEQGVAYLDDRAVSAALQRVRESLFGRLRPLQDEIVFAATLSMSAPVPAPTYIAASVAALDMTLALAENISHTATLYAGDRLHRARWQQAVSLLSIAAILLLAILVVRLLVLRLTRPFNEILQRIDGLLRAQSGRGEVNQWVDGTIDHLGDGTLDRSSEGNEFDVVRRALGTLEEAMEARTRSEGMSASILAGVPQAVIVTDISGLIRVFSPGAELMLGYSASEMIGKQTPLHFHDFEEVQARAQTLSHELDFTVAPDFQVFVARTRNSGKPDEHEWTYIRRDGSRLTVLLTCTLLRDVRGEAEGCIGVATDITERKLAVAETTRMAHYDHLTGLPNRRLLHDRLQVAMQRARREHSRLAMMLIDLDRFKPVNDTHGHSVGDLLLKLVASRMSACLRESDTLARVGGDEFVVVIPNVGSDQDALRVAEKIRLELNRPFELAGGFTVSIACSIGIAIFPEHGTDEKVLASNADDAMYVAKEQGRNRVYLMRSPLDKSARKGGGRELSFMRLVWQRSYRCGNERIDREHLALFDRANTVIHAAIAAGEGGEQLPQALDDLIECVVQHFAHEESILAEHAYAALHEHAALHQVLIARAYEMREHLRTGRLSLGELVTYLSQELVVRHLLKDDRKFFPLFRVAAEHLSESVHEQ